MRSFFHTWSSVLQLRDDTFQWFKFAPGAVPFALGMFLVLSLVAGFGKMLALPAVLNQPTLAEQIGGVDSFVKGFEKDVQPSIFSALDRVGRENLSLAIQQQLPSGQAITAAALSRVMTEAGIDGSQAAEALAGLATVPAEVRARLESEGLTAASLEYALQQTGVSTADFSAALSDWAQQEVAAAGPTVNNLVAGIASGGLNLSDLLTQVALVPQLIGNTLGQIGLTGQQLGAIKEQLAAIPQVGQSVLESMRSNVEAVEPPLGIGFSRFLNLIGQWLSTPFNLLAVYLPVALLSLLIARVLGGKATIRQHLVAVALATAPAFLLMLSYWVDSPNGMTLITLTVVRFLARVLALAGVVWSVAILVKALAHMHEFSLWRAAGTLALTYLVGYLLLPLASLFAGAYFLRA